MFYTQTTEIGIGNMGIAKFMEASLPLTDSYDALRGHLRRAIMKAHGATDSTPWSDTPYVMDVFPSSVVYSYAGKTLKRSYTTKAGGVGEDPTITLGEPKPVHVSYVNTKSTESLAFLTSVPDSWVEMDLPKLIAEAQKADVIITPDLVTVRESVVLEAAKVYPKGAGVTSIPIKLIGPGWGSMAYYPREVLQRDGPRVFKAGTHMMWNHPTATEEADRPEGDLSNLAAVLTKDAVWQDDGIKGPGLYSEAKVFSDYATQVTEKGPHIGVSINAAVKAHEGEAEGRQGRIADQFVHAYSTDFVTKAGAGGAPIVPVTESQRGTAPAKQEASMTDVEAAALQTENAGLQARIKEMETRQIHAVAVTTVGAVLTEAGIDFKQSLLARACKDPVMKEGAVDPEWVKTIVADFTTEESAGKVRGMGAGAPAPNADSAKSLRESLKALGVPEAGLDAAVEGRM